MSSPARAEVCYVPLGDGWYGPTPHVVGAWRDDEQHMAPVSGLVTHAIERHDPRPDLVLGRIAFEILGVIGYAPTHVAVRTVRPGRTIELVEATLVTDTGRDAGARPAVVARAWRVARQDTSSVAGGQPGPLPPAQSYPVWDAPDLWPGGYIRSLEVRRDPAGEPGGGRVWLRTDVGLVAGEDVSPTAAYVGLVDTANGIAVRQNPRDWLFPNLDLTIHLFREPAAGWVGFDTTVTFGSGGVGLTSSVLHDVHGPVGRAAQVLTLRPRQPSGHSPG